MKYSFRNDYSEGCSPEIMEALIRTNNLQLTGYGEDEYATKAASLIKKAINREDVDIHFVPGGTPCNVLAIALALKPYEAVICCDSGHINVHEAGSIEATGHKILVADSYDGKVSPEGVRKICTQVTGDHMVKPTMVFISNATEFATVYTKEELIALRKVCDEFSLYLYMDGARLANALVSEGNDVTLEDICELCDLFYIGGTKNGSLIGEAMIIVNDSLKEGFRYHLKQKGYMLAKGRIMSISFATLFKDDLYLKNAKQANKTAQALKYAFEAYGIPQYSDSKTNQLFPILSNQLLEKIQEDYDVELWGPYDQDHQIVRFTTSWATKEETVLQFVSDLKKYMK